MGLPVMARTALAIAAAGLLLTGCNKDKEAAKPAAAPASDIAIYDVRDKNGIIHVVDRALEPSGVARQVASN